MAKRIKEIELTDNQKVVTTRNYNDERTMAFTMNKVQHRKDSIAWVICGSLLFVFLVMSLGRLSIVGQFFDDIFFNLLFGWFKWPMYLFLFFVDISIFVGLRFKFKTSVVMMATLTSLTLSWLITTCLMMHFWATGLDVNGDKTVGWQANSFTHTLDVYVHQGWLDNTIFSTHGGWHDAPTSKYGIYNGTNNGYAIKYAGGGIFGAVLSGALGYISLPASFILGAFCLFLEIVWILTGNPFFLFLSKERRKGKRVRLLALHYKDNPYEKSQPKLEKKSRWDQANAISSSSQDRPAITNSKTKNNKSLIDFETFHFDEDEDLKSYSVGNSKVDEQLATLTHVEDKPKFTSTINPVEETTDDLEKVSDEPTIDDTSFFDDVLFGDVEKTKETLKESTKVEEEPKAEKKKHSLFGKPKKEKEPKPVKETKADKAEKQDMKKVEVDYSNYQLPSMNLLTDIEPDPEKIAKNEQDTKDKKAAIDNVFAQFGVGAHVVNYIIGPTVTKFEIEPHAGTKVSAISGLVEDLKLALGVQTMRLEAPIKGKNLVGIEIQNGAGSIVNLKDMLENMPMDIKAKPLSFVLGQDVLGKPLYADLAKMPHLLVAGSTGSGKSVMINTLIMSLIMRNTPDEVRFMMVDPKQVELSIYSELPHMLAPVITDPIQAQNALKKVADLMEDRYTLFKDARAKNIEAYNSNRKKGRLPYLVVVVDEMADLMITGDKKDIEDSISRITAKARAAGIHLVLATQRPSVDVITGVIKSNIPTRIAFAVSSGNDSRVILDAMGAETLVGHGDMLFTPPGSSDLVRAQGAYVSDQDIEHVVDSIDAKFKPDYLWTEDDLKAFVKHSNDKKDEYFEEAKEWVQSLDSVSISQIQRRFNVGWNRAGKIADELAEEGIISQANGAQPRKVYKQK